MKWTCLVALALFAGCATKKLSPEQELLKRRNAENRPHLPQPTATRIPVPDGIRSLMGPTGVKIFTQPLTMPTITNGMYIVRWSPGRWVAMAPEGNKLQGSGQVFNGDGQPLAEYSFFTFPTFDIWTAPDGRRYVTSNIPNVPWMVFRTVPLARSTRGSAKTNPVPKWFLDADRKMK